MRTKFLGFLISTKGITIDLDKILAIIDQRELEIVKGIQLFLGFYNFYYYFIKDYSYLALLLIQLTKKGKSFYQEDLQQEAFNYLKLALTIAPILIYFNLNIEIILETNALGSVVVGILLQKGLDSFQYPITFYSKTITPIKIRYNVYDKELLIVTLGLK